MVTVTIYSSSEQPAEAGIPFQLVSADGQVVASAATDVAGVVSFDVDGTRVRNVSLRLDVDAMNTIECPAPQ